MPREQRITSLLAAARAVFVERGYQDTTTAEIAERAGVVEGTVYHYFENKRAIMISVLEDWYASVLPDYMSVLGHIEGARSKLRYLIWQHLSVVHAEPALCRFRREIKDDEDYQRTEAHRFRTHYADMVVHVIQEGIAKGEIRRGASPALVRDMIFGAIDYLTHPYLMGEGELHPDRLADDLADHIYHGLAVEPADEPLSAIIGRLEAATQRLKSA